MAEPQITEIATYLTDRLPDEGVDPSVTREGWRRALRHARERGDIDRLTEIVARHAPGDEKLEAMCEDLRR
ncbi:MAG: hypothetical protein KC621_21655 [Myxococcales bacterium]|nr:hypothetical protein [Myxococcales bacterium]